MTPAEKRQFIRDLVKVVRDDALKHVADMPDEWDGIELRKYLAGKFAAQARDDLLRGRRGRQFRNEVLTRNL